MNRLAAVLLLILFAAGIARAQSDLIPVKTSEKIIVDAVLEEEVWKQAQPADEFWQNFPSDTLKAKSRTIIKMAYDDDFLYISAICYSSGPDFIVTSLKRDYSFQASDNLTFLFDTYSDNTNAFAFGINPYGVRREALISNGGRQFTDFNRSWDNKWFGESRIDGNSWITEIAIPFKTLRFNEGSMEWRLSTYRNDTQNNERSTWSNIPQNRVIMDLSYGGKIKWPEAPKKPKANIAFIPYSIAGVSRDLEDESQTSPNGSINAGFDAKIGVSSGLNLDLTLNPDFSQVEVDEQVTNLDRFEIFFPEKRQFFLENSDLFGGFGLSRVNPFFSRRIGVARDTTTGQNIQNPILYGARLSGKVNDDLRVGFLNMQTAREVENGLPSFNYTVAAIQQKVFSRSNVSFLFVNKQAVNPEESQGDFSAFNRIAGLEYRLASGDGRWIGKTYFHKAFLSEKQDDSYIHGAQIEFIRKNYRLEWAHGMVGNGFDAQVGFVPRKDYYIFSPEIQLFFYPEKGPITQHSINVDTRWFVQIGKAENTILDPWSKSEQQVELEWEFQFLTSARASLKASRNYLILLNDFDPTRLQEDGIFLAAGSSYDYFDMSMQFSSDGRKLFSYMISPQWGQFFNGHRSGISGQVNYRIQPYGVIGLSGSFNNIKLSSPFVPSKIWLVGPKFDFTFTKSLFLTAFFQYNSQLNNLNINTRFQWRFAPVSDFFIVYTDNYLTDSFSNFTRRNHALVAKLTYWLNL